MPLVPEPFSRVTISRQSLFLRNTSVAKIWAEFCPNLNIPQYRESLSKEKQEELDKRASTLRKRAISNHYFASSEFFWEVSAWNDVFGLLYDDERFRMDKRPYEFLDVDKAGNKTVKKRITDATIGLRSYDDFFLQRGYICNAPDCKDDHATMQPDKRLSDHDLRSMMCDPECGRILDGTWGKTELLFPFAVYEAKKRATNYGQAEDQIYHACRTYLAMLDDLARNPDNVAEYQTEESSKYQLFAFTSCGSYWQVFMAWNMLHDCMVETIWEGDVKEFSRAFDLICIVDQIQEYAVHHHRPFVMKHLEAWHTRHQKMIQAAKGAIRETNATTAYMDMSEDDSDKVDSNPLDGGNTSLDPHPDSDVKDFDVNNVDRFEQLVYLDYSEPAEWFLLKLRTDITRRDMSNETRRRNRSLREAARASEAAKQTAKTLARGRPRKNKVTKSTKSPKQGRPRGRPPKAKVTRNGNTST
ncbi:hypothetical protein THARTR1_07745 [Trichoderma harzianum]|uniref:Uncharacterized protein n=1 Tax=Trichoderma harzianum TaxID=5544 RepID=A0A2K0U1H5_TRIHA|nr:hypothetical protein THARTR1_07745 [Trichoderma harzianum]